MLRTKLLADNSIRLQYLYKARRYTSGTDVQNKYFKGNVPKSLLLKQEQRLNTSNPKSLEDENIMSSVMTDVFNLFKPNAMSREDEEFVEKEYEQQIQKFIKGTEFKQLLQNKLQLNQKSLKSSSNSLVDGFKLLTPFEYDVIHKFVLDADSNLNDWKSLPTYTKQLQYFMAYGPIGPRSDISLNSSPFTAMQPKKDSLSRIIIGTFLLVSFLGFIKYMFTKEEEDETQ